MPSTGVRSREFVSSVASHVREGVEASPGPFGYNASVCRTYTETMKHAPNKLG